ncbi:FixH family protein [Uliginosibacterium gangwonense]|uniref:FixH family protein n=1 Tax=Uliginosibacterium gangwonense TaxID=392736 RepID=UPI000360E916|nr:FixH family protein [Uliginosibacterium gangwonense]
MLNPTMDSKRPWYREPWPWILFGLPGIVVIASFVTLFIALQTDDGVVSDDYYKQGLAINKSLERDELAKQKGIHAFVSLREGMLQMRIRTDTKTDLPDTLQMHWIHPTRAGADQIVTLKRGAEGYEGKLAAMPAGRWNVSVEDLAGQWRVVGAVKMPFTGELEIQHMEAVTDP